MRLVVGIGNPGPRYAGTRHNVGFEVVEILAARAGSSFAAGRCQALEAPARLGGESVLLALPTTYVNLTGQAVAGLLSWYRLEPGELLVVTDCVQLPLGSLRVRPNGSSAGHKGVQSVIDALGTDDFARLRIGVGSGRGPSEALSDYVLARFRAEEREIVDEAIRSAADAVECWVREDVETVMGRFNRRKD